MSKPTILHKMEHAIDINIPKKATPGQETKRFVSNPVVKTPVPVFYEYPKDEISISPSRLIEQHLSEIRRRIDLHSRAANHYEYWNRILGYPTAVLSGFMSSTMMLQMTSDGSDSINILNLSLSCILFFFSTTKVYLKYEEKNKSHDISSKLYTTLSRSAELRLIKGHDEIGLEEKKDMYKDLVEQMSIIEQFDLTIPDMIIKKYLQCQLSH